MIRPSSAIRLSLLLIVIPLMGMTSATADISVHSDDKLVILVRHAEKCTAPEDNPGLTRLGHERAAALTRALRDIPIDAIYSTPLERTLDTVRPLADERGLEVIQTPIRAGFLVAMVESITSSDARTVVVSGHSNTTPRVVNLLAGTSYPDLDESEYDRLYLVHLPVEGAPRVSILRFGPESGTVEDC